MTNCKNCKMTDEYCASGDCPTSQSPRNDLATKPQAVDLTEQLRKGELFEGWYWVEYSVDGVNGVEMMKYIPELNGFSFTIIKQVLAEVPDYIDWRNMVNCACEEHKANTELLAENAELKELLKECSYRIDWRTKTGHKPSDERKQKLFDKIDEVLK